MFQGLQKVLCLLCCFRQVVLERFCVTDDICTFSLIAGTPRRRRLRTRWCRRDWEKFLWILMNWICLLLQRVECKGLPGLKQTFGPGLIHFRITLILRLNHFVSHINSFGDNQPQPCWESNHWDLPPFLLPCFPSPFSVFWPIGQQILLTACHSTDFFFCFNDMCSVIDQYLPAWSQ